MPSSENHQVTFLITEPLTSKIEENFGLEHLHKLQISINIIDISKIYYPHSDLVYSHRYQDESSAIINKLNINYFHNIETYSSLQQIIDHLQLPDRSIIFLNCSMSGLPFISLLYFLRKQFANFRYASHMPFAFPGGNSYFWSSRYHITKNLKIFIKKIVLKIVSFATPKLDLLYLASDQMAKNVSHLIGPNTQVEIVGNSDCISSRKDFIPLLDDSYILYLDSGISDCIDYDLFGMAGNIDSEKYYDALGKYLTLVSKIFKKEIMIAAHPASTFFSGQSGKFLDFQYFKFKTAQLSSYATFVVCDYPTNSLTFPIIQGKPIYLFSFHSLINNYKIQNWHYRCFKALEISLGKNFISVDEMDQTELELSMRDEIQNLSMYPDFVSNILGGFNAQTPSLVDNLSALIQEN